MVETKIKQIHLYSKLLRLTNSADKTNQHFLFYKSIGSKVIFSSTLISIDANRQMRLAVHVGISFSLKSPLDLEVSNALLLAYPGNVLL